MKKLFTKFGAILAIAAMLSGWFAVPTIAGGARDCDANAVIRCGAYTLDELNKDIKNGTGYSHQSGKELTALFTKFGYTPNLYGVKVREGRVTRDNKVYIGNTRVASDVYSMGRSYMTGSKDVSGISYPLWLRHPSVSFRSSSIDAFVLLNYDGSFRMAVIKSCGNIVPGKVKATPSYKLIVRKFNDLNANGKLDTGEPRIPGVRFTITGPASYNKSFTTDSGGNVITTLPYGLYTIKEQTPAGWKVTTANPQEALMNRDRIRHFGNVRIQRAVEIGLNVIKFEDINGNRVQDDTESNLSGWQFRVTGPNGFSRIVTTDQDGDFRLTGLQPGVYTVTEIQKSGWTNTTGLAITRNVTTDVNTQNFIFGNRKVTPPPPPVTPPGGGDVPLPVSGPMETAATAFGLSSLGGGTLAWIKSRKRFLTSLIKK